VLTHTDHPSILGPSDYVTRFFSNGAFYFVFISGYLFWHLIERYEYKSFLKKKIYNVFIPYIFVMTLAITLFSFLGIFQLTAWTPIREILVGGGLIGALWFLPMILLVFIFSPIIVASARSPSFFLIILLFIFFSITLFRPDLHVYPLYMVFHFLGIYLKMNQFHLINNACKIALLSLPIALLMLMLDVNQASNGLPYFWPILEGKLLFNYAQLQKLFFLFVILGVLFWIERDFKHVKFQC
jgi:hypothetical protein